jgi:hypothetical protein
MSSCRIVAAVTRSSLFAAPCAAQAVRGGFKVALPLHLHALSLAASWFDYAHHARALLQ